MVKRMLTLLVCALLVLSLMTGCKSQTEEQKTDSTSLCFAETTGGSVMGYNYDGVDTYYGIQYGTAERFKPAQSYKWDGLRYCMVLGEVAPQTTETSIKNSFDAMNYSHVTAENEQLCLQLNVWTPDAKAEKAKPVIVWLHGGGYSSGSSAEYTFYEGASIAKSGDVVFVSINHRLNCLGYLDLSAYGDEYKYSGNAGMSDIVLALEWVKANIASFGGDPANVTIIGQSGGGGKVTTLMGMPAAQGLFHKAAALSGGSVQVTRTTETAQAETAAVVDILGLTGQTDEAITAALTALSYEELATACNQAKVSYGPVVDGDYYPDGTYAMSKDIPFMCGNVLGEFSTNFSSIVFGPNQEAIEAGLLNKMSDEQIKQAYLAKYGDLGEQIMAEFSKAYPDHNAADGLYINNRLGFFSAIQLADAMAGFGGQVYTYVAAYDYPMFGGIVPIHTASDVPFWFDNDDDIREWTASDETAASKLADQMSGALVSFAYTGSPSKDSLKWELYTPANGACMVFDRVSQIKYNHDKALCELLSQAAAAAAQNK